MPAMLLSRNYLRRRDTRRRVMFAAILECRGMEQKVRVVDFSMSGVRIDGIKDLANGDPVRISLTPGLIVEGRIAWVAWHKAGVKLAEPLIDDHPAYEFLTQQASMIERARTRAHCAKPHTAQAVDNPANPKETLQIGNERFGGRQTDVACR